MNIPTTTLSIGLDIGSTTIKCVVLDGEKIIYSIYQRHLSCIVDKAKEILSACFKAIGEIYSENDVKFTLSISGSAGMGIAQSCDIPFIQEVFATRIAAKALAPQADVIIELGGEDAKILFLTKGTEVRMNGSCAGGTGAFIDQMATLLHLSPEEMNSCAKESTRLYTIASRCGVFAKSDIQPLLNQGALKSDISASIFGAVVNQTIAGLAQGRPIAGNILYLGGPLSFLSSLRESFDATLKTRGILPENSLYFVAMGAAMGSKDAVSYPLFEAQRLFDTLESYSQKASYNYINPLFATTQEYEEFTRRHNKATVKSGDKTTYQGDCYMGIDAGSTTVKAVIIGTKYEILHSFYKSNSGNPVPIIKDFLEEFYDKYPNLIIKTATVTGYGEEMIKNALGVDYGIVETLAHFTGAKTFLPDVEFIIDIGGQDIKCFKIKDGIIDDIFLNEACSSGCGSFLQTFANALGYNIEDFARMGLFADKPVDLGSRCTVFMNSSVKQAQKDGADIENISAGLSISVVKNALYKVIRATTTEELGKKIVVQGGTFLNDAVLRAFEQELKTPVIRPSVAGLMGAYGCAIYSMEHKKQHSTLIDSQAIKSFSHSIKTAKCGLCSNNCTLTVNSFGGGRKYISGNKCERPVTKKATINEDNNIFDYKLHLLENCKKSGENTIARRGTVGIPLVLNMFELLPFWSEFFVKLGFCVKASPLSSRNIYLKGQSTIPSDTVCYPAKLAHGHIQHLIDETLKDEKEKVIFYPCMSYNFDEKLGDNHYNCPVVAYYPEVIAANSSEVKNITFIKDYYGIHRKGDFPYKAYKSLKKYFPDITLQEVKSAAKSAYLAYDKFQEKIVKKGEEIITLAEKNHKQVMVLCGRPYHLDPEVNHSIDKLILNCGWYIISEEVFREKVKKPKINVLNQWTYHARLYAAAKYVSTAVNMNLIQLVSFGCGVDAITTDEIRSILTESGKIYTQIKIDEITNPGAVKIRLRSLLAAIDAEPPKSRKL